MRVLPTAVLAVLAGVVVGAAPADVSAFRQPVREQYGQILKLRQDLEDALRSQQHDEEFVKRTQARLCKEAEGYRQLLNDFQNATTRHGLDEEFLLLRECLIAMDEIGAMYAIIGGERRPPENLTPEELDGLKARVLQELDYSVRDVIDEKLKVEGLADILLAGSFEEARDTAVAKVGERLRETLADEMERVVGLRFYDLETLGESLEFKARHLVEKAVAKLLVRVTTNEFVIEWAAGVLIRWIGPELQEAFREKGNHEFRVGRSVGTLEAAGRRLNEFTGEADIRDVSRAIDDAQRAIGATQYLRSDLTRANNMALLAQLTDKIGELQRTIHLTSVRFLLDKPAFDEHFKIADRFVRELRRFADCSDAQAVEPDEGEQDASLEGIAYVEFPPRFLIHIIETRTAGGPEEVDVWILHSERPNDDGVVLTADGTGGNFVNKADKTMGPYTNSHQLCPVLKRLGLEGIWLGGQYISCQPRG